jgi:hypothetical protein
MVRELEHPLEVAVSRHIGVMPFLWVAVNDDPSAKSDRGVIEAGAIALLSNYDHLTIDAASDSWLGSSADRSTIRASGLWNVSHVRDETTTKFIDALSQHVANL